MEQAAERTERFHYADRAALRRALYDNLRPAERISVAEAATRYLMLDNPGGGYSGPFTFDRVPYLRRPMECLSADSGYTLVAVMGVCTEKVILFDSVTNRDSVGGDDRTDPPVLGSSCHAIPVQAGA